MNKLIISLFLALCLAALFAQCACFTDGRILPKRLLFYAIMGVVGVVWSIGLLLEKKMCISLQTIAAIVVLCCTVEMGIGFLQFLRVFPADSSFHFVTGSLDNPAGFAACLCAGCPFALFLLHRMRGKSVWMHVFLSLSLLMIVLSGSRAGIIACMVVIGGDILMAHRFRLDRKGIVWIVLGIFLTLCLFFVGYHLKKDSADERLFIWQCAWEMIKDSPLFGYGVDGFMKHYMDYQAAYFVRYPDSLYASLADNIKHPFNELLLLGIQFGLVGWGVLLVVIFFLIHCYRKRPTESSRMSLLTLLGVGAFAMFSYPLSYPFIWVVMMVCILILVMNAYPMKVGERKCIVLFGLMVFSLSSTVLYQTVQRICRELEWKSLADASALSLSEDIIGRYAVLAEDFSRNPYFLYNYAAVLYQADECEASLQVAEKCRSLWADYELELMMAECCRILGRYDDAECHLLTAHNMCPVRFVPLYEVMLLYEEMDKDEKAIHIAREIVSKRIKVDSYKVREIKQEAHRLIQKASNGH